MEILSSIYVFNSYNIILHYYAKEQFTLIEATLKLTPTQEYR